MIDTHQHLWNPARFCYPWLEGCPEINREFNLDAYRKAADGTGITSSVFIECAAGAESLLDEASWILDLALQPDNHIAGVVASIWPEDEDFSSVLRKLAPHPKLKGLRRTLHTEPDELSRTSRFRDNVNLLKEYSLSFDLCVLERQLPLAIELADACPDTRFILDHCGVPDINANSPEFWRSQIRELSLRPNVACKISGLMVYAGETQRTADGLFPWFSHVVDCFGWERVLWGGDWPVCTLATTLKQWVSITHEMLEKISATPEQREALFEGNAKNSYRL